MVRMPTRTAAALRSGPTLAGTVLIATVLAATVALAACGSTTTSGGNPAAGKPSSPSASPSAPGSSAKPGPRSAPPPAGPMITVVRLGTTFSPDTLSLASGQKFEVIVSTSVEPSGDAFPQHCAAGTVYPVGDGMLSVTCPASGSYLFTAGHPGTTTLTATVHPHCFPGEMCPQWITEAVLHITVT